MSVFDHIRAEVAGFSVKGMCALLGVSRSGDYDHLARQGQPTPPDDERLVTKDANAPERSQRYLRHASFASRTHRRW
jgi:hypothetical protein